MERSAAVPVTMGSAGAVSLALDAFLVTHATFPAGEFLAPHTHARAALAIMMDGSFDLLIGGRTLACDPGAAVAEPAEERHANRLGSRGASVLVIQPHPVAVSRLGPVGKLFDAVTFRAASATAPVARRIARELRQRDGVTPLAVEGLALELMALFGRQRQPRRPAQAPSWLARVRELVHARFRNPPSMEELAREAGVHPDSVARSFSAWMGVPVGSYIRRLRLDWAAARMADRNQTLSNIALEAGFADQSHFTRAFRAHTGLTPAEYRRSIR
jgi:AraC family transcriptional regulator